MTAASDAFSHPDFTVGSGISPDRATRDFWPLAGSHRRSGLGQHSAWPHPNPEGLLNSRVSEVGKGVNGR